MKKIELNNVGKKVLKVLTWLITLSVVSTLGISGTGWFGALTFYAAILFLVFAYFKDEDLQATVKKSLVITVLFVVVGLVATIYSNALDTFDVKMYENNGDLTPAYLISNFLGFLIVTAKYVTCSVFLLLDLFAKDNACSCCCDKKEATEEVKEVEEAKEETKEAEETTEE